ncbi:hypothetical protein N8703_02885 [Verrucomicrobia bacterium]|nr:hypothetical protein [Verrucomicrobiota bacterium]
MSKSTSLELIVNCSQSKVITHNPPITFAETKGTDLRDLLDNWIKKTRSANAKTPAGDLYRGQYWSKLRSIIARQKSIGTKVRVQIASAGFGVLQEMDMIPDYSATFQSNSSDCVIKPNHIIKNRVNTLKKWWENINLAFSQSNKAKSFANHTNPNSLVIVVLSIDYLMACEEELVYLRRRLKDPDKLLIFAPPQKNLGTLSSNLIEVDVDLQCYLGGTRLTLGVRMLEWMLHTVGDLSICSVKTARALFVNLREKQGKKMIYKGVTMTDAQVTRFIRSRLNAGQSSYTPILRQLRGSGFACEVKRFKILFKKHLKKKRWQQNQNTFVGEPPCSLNQMEMPFTSLH